MNHTTHSWKGTDNLNVFGQEWSPSNTPTAVICLVHGMYEHSGRYEHVARWFNDKNVAVIAHDQRGHGKSEGAKGHVDNYNILLDQVDAVIETARKKYPNTPIFTYGHSMGGNIIINHTLRRTPKINGTIVTAPWLKLAFNPPAVKLFMGKIMRNIYPKYTETDKNTANGISRDAAVVQKYINDPLVHNKISTSYYFSIHEAGLWAFENAKKLQLPMLLMHGDADEVTSYDASKNFAQQMQHLVTFKSWEGLYHEIHNEPEQEVVFSNTWDWMEANI